MAEPETSRWRELRRRVKGPVVQEWVVEANDGIIATAGLLEGFAGAGANDQLLITAALAATIAGALSVGGRHRTRLPAGHRRVRAAAAGSRPRGGAGGAVRSLRRARSEPRARPRGG